MMINCDPPTYEYLFSFINLFQGLSFFFTNQTQEENHRALAVAHSKHLLLN